MRSEVAVTAVTRVSKDERWVCHATEVGVVRDTIIGATTVGTGGMRPAASPFSVPQFLPGAKGYSGDTSSHGCEDQQRQGTQVASRPDQQPPSELRAWTLNWVHIV